MGFFLHLWPQPWPNSMFQDEVDEPSSPGLFQDEHSEGEGCEGQPPLTALKPACVLQDEPDEIEDEHCLPFGIEPDEQLKLYIFSMLSILWDVMTWYLSFSVILWISLIRSDDNSDDSAYFADCDDDNEIGQPQRSIVQLSHSVLSNFLKGQIMKLSAESVSEPKKKRHYDNTKRAAAAEHAKKMRCKTANQSRLPRNSEEAKAMLWYLCVLNLLFFFGVCLKFYVWGYCDISKERLQKLMEKGCKCASGDCYKKLDVKEIKDFLDIFESRTKREQDAILYMSCEDSSSHCGDSKRSEYYFLGTQLRRQCFESLLGMSSHRVDKIGSIDMRYRDTKRPSKPSPLTASIDAFVMVLYNSVAEPLPTKWLEWSADDFISLLWPSLEVLHKVVFCFDRSQKPLRGLFDLGKQNAPKLSKLTLGQTSGKVGCFANQNLKRMTMT